MHDHKENEGIDLPNDEIRTLAVHGAASAPLTRLKLATAVDPGGGQQSWADLEGALLYSHGMQGPRRPWEQWREGGEQERENEREKMALCVVTKKKRIRFA